MKRTLLVVAASIAGLLVAAGQADAHHSWQLDRSKTVTLIGTVTRFDFANPHVRVFFDSKDEAGNAVNWSAGGPSPNQLARGGWSRDSIKPGDEITVAGYRSNASFSSMRFDTITLPDGRVIAGNNRR